MNGQCLTHQTLGSGQSTGGRPIGFSHGQQFGAIEQPRLQQIDALKPCIHLQAIKSVRRDRFAVNISVHGESVAKIIQQSPLEGAQQGFQRSSFSQGRQRGGVVIEHRRMRIFGGQQANQQFVEIEAAEQCLADHPGRGSGTLHAPDVLQFTLAAKLHFQRHEWPRQCPGLAPRTAQHRPQPTLRREEVHQGAGFAVGTRVEDVGGLGGRWALRH